MDDKLIELCIMLGFFVFMKIWDGIRSGDDAKRLQKEIEDEEKGESALSEKRDEVKTVDDDTVQEVNTETAEDDPEETLVQKAMEEREDIKELEAVGEQDNVKDQEAMEEQDDVKDLDDVEDQDDLAMNERTWKCPRCGRINPAYQYACNCGNRFR